MPMRCRSPPDRRAFICPMSVSYPSGRVSMNGAMPAPSAARRTSSIVASGLAMRMFSAMVVSNR